MNNDEELHGAAVVLGVVQCDLLGDPIQQTVPVFLLSYGIQQREWIIFRNEIENVMPRLEARFMECLMIITGGILFISYLLVNINNNNGSDNIAGYCTLISPCIFIIILGRRSILYRKTKHDIKKLCQRSHHILLPRNISFRFREEDIIQHNHRRRHDNKEQTVRVWLLEFVQLDAVTASTAMDEDATIIHADVIAEEEVMPLTRSSRSRWVVRMANPRNIADDSTRSTTESYHAVTAAEQQQATAEPERIQTLLLSQMDQVDVPIVEASIDTTNSTTDATDTAAAAVVEDVGSWTAIVQASSADPATMSITEYGTAYIHLL